MNKCDTCVTDKSQCDNCIDNPKYANVPVESLYQAYIPTCPRGYSDCVNDPAYIKYTYPDWYKKLYGDISPEDAAKQNCQKSVEDDPDEEYYCYDNEDK